MSDAGEGSIHLMKAEAQVGHDGPAGSAQNVRPAHRYIGQAVKRREDLAHLTGRARFVDDVVLPRLVHASIVRSHLAHARILAVDTSPALSHPGVLTAVTGRDIEAAMRPIVCNWILPGMKAPARPVLVSDKARFVGDAVAVVVAESRQAAGDAVRAVRVSYDELPAVTNQERALEPGAPTVHDDAPGNLAAVWKQTQGDFEAAAGAAAVVVRQRLVNQRLVPSAMETRGVVADYHRGTGELTVWTATQAPHLIKRFLAETLGLPEHRIRVVAPDVGGGFGSKLHFYPEEALVAHLSIRLGRPVKWIETRSEAFVATTHGRDHIEDLEVAAEADGRITGLRYRVCANLGAYLSSMGPGIPTVNFALMATGSYRIPVVDLEVKAVLTNTTPVDTYRGAGRPEATYQIERAVDLVARRLSLDPAELRQRNYVESSAFPYTSAAGLMHDSGDYEANLERALQNAGYADLRQRQAELREEGRYIGLGISSYVEFCGLGPSRLLGLVGLDRGGWESATVRAHPSGQMTVFSGSSAHGQGHLTSFAQIAADRLGLPIDDVVIVENDTARVQFGNATYNSRSTPVGAIAILRAVEGVVAKATRIAGHLLEADVDDIALDQGRFQVRGSPEREVTFAAVCRQAYLGHNLPDGMEPGLEEKSYYDPSGLTTPFGTHVAVVEVDVETGDVLLERLVAVDDCGTVINPLLAAGQVHGGLAQGIGQAMWEGVEYDERGQPLTVDFRGYNIPKAHLMPVVETDHTITPSPMNPLGVKGLGEAGTLSPFGIVHLDMPLYPERVWRAIQAARTGLSS
jgi:aerobic carbon-monoxide dehydrogenase large subunit